MQDRKFSLLILFIIFLRPFGAVCDTSRHSESEKVSSYALSEG